MLISVGIVYGTFWFFEGQAQAADDAARSSTRWPSGQVKEPPAPNLQTQPFKDVYCCGGRERRSSTQLRLGRQGRRRRRASRSIARWK